jgi:hypothetical protein
VLTVGAGLIIYPELGKAVKVQNGETPRNFVAAMYAGANSMAVVGASEFEPRNRVYRWIFMANSLVGVGMLSMLVTYILQVYSALQRRNVAALQTHLATAETGDAAEFLVLLLPRGDAEDAVNRMRGMASQMASVKETHHFYSMLMYFRFAEVQYAMPRLTLVSLDAVALMRSGLSEGKYGSLMESGGVEELWRGSLRLLTRLGNVLLPGRMEDRREEPDDAARERWRRRYFAAVRRMKEAGIETAQDVRAGAEKYVRLRTEWDAYLRAYARFMAYGMEEVDVTGTMAEAEERAREKVGAWGVRHAGG